MSLRAALKAKRQLEVEHVLGLGTAEDRAAAEDALHTARARARRVDADDQKAVDAAQGELDVAERALEDLHYRMRLHNLAPSDYEALVAAHPPLPDEQKRGEQWHRATFLPALIAASVADDEPMSVEEWTAELDSARWAKGEVDELFVACLAVNLRPRSTALPKGSPLTLG